MRFKIHWDSLIVGSKFAVFALVYFVFEGLYLGGQFNGGFFALPDWGGGIFVGAYTWRGLFSASEWSYKNQNSCYGVNFRAGIFDRVI